MTTFKTLFLFSLFLCSLQAFAQQGSDFLQSDTVYRIDQHIDTTTMNPIRLPGKTLPVTRIVKTRSRTSQYTSETAGTIKDHRFEPSQKGDKGSAVNEPWQPNIALQLAGRYTFHRIHQSSGYSTCVYLEPSEGNQPRRYILLETPFLAKLTTPADVDRQFPMGNSERSNLEALRKAVRMMLPSRTRRTTPDRVIANDDPGALPEKISTPNSKSTPDTGVFTYVEYMPEFPGGFDSMRRFIAAHMQYPSEAKKNGISGQVVVRFIVHPDGSTSDFVVVRKLGYGCDEEALRVLKTMPKWKPGRKDGHPVSVYFTFPVQFQLQ